MTIFITSFHPFISRNILQTQILDTLKSRPDLRVVTFVPDYKKDYFEKKFARGNVVIEGVDVSFWASGWANLLFKRFARSMLDTSSTRIQKRWKFYNDKNLIYFVFSYLLVPPGKLRIFRRLVRFFDYLLCSKSRFGPYFERYNPEFVFSTDIQNEHDVCLLQTARCYGVKTVGMVRSWDNLTSYQGVMRVIPGELLVPTELVKLEAVRYHDVPENRITVVGKPHYDNYLRRPRMNREEFYKKFGLNPSKKLIFFNPWGDTYAGKSGADRYVLDILKEIDANILVRFNPGHKVTLGDDFKPSANMIFDKPGVVFTEESYGDRDISEEDDMRLMNELFHSDVVVTCSSTIVIDAAIFDKPMVGTALVRNPVGYWGGVEKFYHYEHFYNVVKTGGIRLAKTREELLGLINGYLKDPTIDREGRRRIFEEQCYNLEGKSSQRVLEVLNQYV